jgi:hypothetical protein
LPEKIHPLFENVIRPEPQHPRLQAIAVLNRCVDDDGDDEIGYFIAFAPMYGIHFAAYLR